MAEFSYLFCDVHLYFLFRYLTNPPGASTFGGTAKIVGHGGGWGSQVILQQYLQEEKVQIC